VDRDRLLSRTALSWTGSIPRRAGSAVFESYPHLVQRNVIVEIAAARPNFMKIAPIHREASHSERIDPILVHTGQHYDSEMSEVFFSDLSIEQPTIRLNVGSGSHAKQTAGVLVQLEPHLERLRPAAVLVVGDVNSTLAAALCAAKLNIPVVHVEAGLRSFNRAMPEEVNRIVTDAISDLLLAPSNDAVENLLREGHPSERVHMVGNLMIDTLDSMLAKSRSSSILERIGLTPGAFFLATLHRPTNVDDLDQLEHLVDILVAVSRYKPVAFVVHPRTKAMINGSDQLPALRRAGVMLLEPLGYLDFLALEAASAGVLTDSGGIQEETTVLGVPCLTLRDETERPVTVTQGTNHVVGQDLGAVLDVIEGIVSAPSPGAHRPPLWDGRSAGRVVAILEERYG
jgi:UDP-N-acetylglucosamine 2-epimerase (non-hydrolysing)